jgi:hypothetical protein
MTSIPATAHQPAAVTTFTVALVVMSFRDDELSGLGEQDR